MKYTRAQLLEQFPEPFVHMAEATGRSWLGHNGESPFVVWPFHGAPDDLRTLCSYNGGDEDWLVVTEKEPDYLPVWIESLDTCHEPDVYILNNLVIYVGSHS